MKKHLQNITFLFITALSLFYSEASAVTQIVTVQNYQFTPNNFNLNLGDTVMWVSINGSHTTTSVSVPSGASPWDNPVNASSDTFIYIPAVTGTYIYHCDIHPTMNGQFTVTGCTPPDYSLFIGLNSTACEGTTFLFGATSPVATSYQWYQDNNLIAGATNDTYEATNAGTYYAIALNSCGTDTTPNNVLQFVPNPIVDIIASDDTVCSGQTVTFIGSGGLTYEWLPAIGLSATTGDTVTATPTSLLEVILQGTDFNQCSSNDTFTITVLTAPIAGFTFTQAGSTVTTSNTSAGATIYAWDFGDGFTTSDAAPSHTYSNNGVFVIQLITTNAAGCTDTTEQTVDLSSGIAEAVIAQVATVYYDAPAKQVSVTFNQVATGTVTVFDLTGITVVAQKIAQHTQIIDVNDLFPGIYFVHVAALNKTATVKLVIE